ncbi:xanthine dehydrogenase accessory protein XdhC [bacterium]|nr:xanthine dehydrogenase accessory protein XdhC [bacterium]
MALLQMLSADTDIVHVRLSQVHGSSPRDAGAEIFVSTTMLHGTIGGGQLEYMAIDKARAMLRGGRASERMNVRLGPEIGQCCGGRVIVDLNHMNDADRAAALANDETQKAAMPHIYVLGAGHVGRALALFFQFLPVRCVLIDSRAEEFSLCVARVERRLSALPEVDVRQAPAGSAFIVLTHDHALDFLLTSEALDRGDAAYVGLIGSATKRVKFERFHKNQSTQTNCTDLICPIGVSESTDKRPEIIAALVVAEVMTALTAMANQTAEPVT